MSILPTVYIVDDDPAILKALTRLLQAEGLAAKTVRIRRKIFLPRMTRQCRAAWCSTCACPV